MQTFASIFTGGGLADVGAEQAGCDLIWGMELRPEIAEIAKANLNHTLYIKSVTQTDWMRLERPDILWASPPCLNYSVAKTGAREMGLDIEIAQSVCDALTILTPHVFILENVEGYKRSRSLAMIQDCLARLGYWPHWEVVNAADFGVPQTRRRLILRAIRGGFLPSLPLPVQWRGWYEAIKDLILELPEAQLAQWQIDRLPDEIVQHYLVESKDANRQYGNGLRYQVKSATKGVTDYKPSHAPKAILLDVTNTIRNCTVRNCDQPAITITADKMRRPSSTPKALLISGQGDRGKTVTYRHHNEPALTITRSSGNRQLVRAVIEAVVVQMTSRCMARFQTLPDWYELPTNNPLACTIIGNGVPCELSRQIVQGLLEVLFAAPYCGRSC